MTTTGDDIAAAKVECRTCGHRASAPEPHNAVMQIRCPEASGWGPPQPRPWEQPKADPDAIPTYRPGPKPRKR